MTAWETAVQIKDEEAKLKAESKVLGMQKPLAASDRQSMRRALEAVKGHSLSEREEPASDYLAAKLDEVEAGDPTMSPLDEVVSRSEAATPSASVHYRCSGPAAHFSEEA